MSLPLDDDDEWSNEQDEEDDGSDFGMADEEEEGNNDQQIIASSGSISGIMEEITSLLQGQSEVSFANGLTLNKEMQRRLHEVRERIQSLLRTIQERLKVNEKRLHDDVMRKKRNGGIGMRGAYLNGGTFYFKGNMFFKDLNCRNCPNNPDYEYRKNTEQEMFPMDFELRSRHIWSLVDKVSIVQAIKEQAIDHINDQKKRRKTRLEPNKTTESIKKKVSLHSGKLVHLLSEVDDKFRIDWEQIAVHNVRHRHTPATCEAMWNVYLQPALKRNAWSEDENRQLLEAAKAHNFQDWEAIAAAVGKRSDYQCFVQYWTSICFQQRKSTVKWTKEKDQRLLKVIEKNTANGMINWNGVCAHFPHRPKTAIQARYMYSLNPQISHDPFTPAEDLLLLAAVQEYGTRFATYPRTLFPNRSITQLRSRYYITLQNRHKLQPWSSEDDKKLMEFIAQYGTSAWQQCATSLGNHTRISCRTRFITIQSFFARNPNAAIEDLPRRTVRFVDGIITAENWSEKMAELRENPNANFKREKRKRIRMAPKSTEAKPKVKRNKKNPATPKIKRKKVKKEPKPKEPKKPKKPPKVSVPKTRRKSLYVERLRQVGIKLYHFFKYSYNFRLGEDPCTKWPSTFASLRILMNALDFNMPPVPFIHDDNLPVIVRHKIKELLTSNDALQLCPTGYRLPPSWSTAMAFRTLCVRAAQVEADNVKTQERREVTEKSDAVQLFRQRLHSLLYKTALLSRLSPHSIANRHGCMESLPLVMETNANVYCGGLVHVTQKAENLKQEFQPEISHEPHLIANNHLSLGEITMALVPSEKLFTDEKSVALQQINAINERKLKRRRPQEEPTKEKHPRLIKEEMEFVMVEAEI